MRSRRIACLAALAVAGWLTAAGVAAAHDDLVSASPADGESVDVSPQAVELEFSGPPQTLGDATALLVTEAGSAGAVVSTGDVVVDGATVRRTLQPDLPRGEYVVVYRVVSSDGHQIEGSTHFYVGPVPPAGVPFGTDPERDRLPGVVGFGIGALALAVVATLIVRRASRPSEPT